MSDSEQPDKPKQKWASYKTLAEAVSSQEEKEGSPPKEEDAPPETEDSAMQTSPGRTSETESEAVATSPKRERSQSEDESVSSKKRYKSPTMRRISTEFESKLTLEETSKAKDTSDERVCEKKEEAIPTTSTRRDKKSQADETLPKKKLRRSSPKRLGMEDLERLIYERNQEILRSLDESDSEDENPEEEKSEDKKDVEEEYEEEYEAEKDVKEEYEAEKDVEEEYEEEHDAEKDVEEEYEAEKDVEEEYEEGYEEELYKEKRRNLHKTLHQIWNFAEEPNYEQPHLVLATQNVGNDLPIGIFEIFASLIERVTERPVVLIHQRSPYRRIATELVDIAVMPPYENWRYGKLLPLSFVFEHALNKDNTPHVYADVIVSKNRSSSIRSIMDLRGCRCAMTRKRNPFSAAGLLLDELRSKGEDKSFFSTILKATSQIHVLDMIRNDEADVGIVDSAVFYNYRMEYGVRSLEVLDSLGPMPPYRIMIKKKRNKDLFDKLFTYIRESNEMEEVFDMLSSYFVSGFADNFDDYYCVEQELTETEEPAEAE